MLSVKEKVREWNFLTLANFVCFKVSAREILIKTRFWLEMISRYWVKFCKRSLGRGVYRRGDAGVYRRGDAGVYRRGDAGVYRRVDAGVYRSGDAGLYIRGGGDSPWISEVYDSQRVAEPSPLRKV